MIYLSPANDDILHVAERSIATAAESGFKILPCASRQLRHRYSALEIDDQTVVRKTYFADSLLHP